MNKSMLDILVCPIDKYFPLEIFEIESNENNIIEGVLYCAECYRFYPIIEEIPIMLPDELREKNSEIKFLQKNNDVLPEKITKYGMPWHL